MASRTTLKTFFKKGAIPKESEFAELIDSMVIQDEDHVVKSPNDPLSIKAIGQDEALLNFYRVDKGQTIVTWQLKQSPGGTSGLSIHYGSQSRWFIASDTGKVGLGTTAPGGALHIATGAADAQATAPGGAFIYGAEKADLVLTRRHHPDKAPLNGYPGSLIDFRTTNTVHEWSVAQILGMVDLNIPDRHAGGIAFLTSGGGTADASKTNPSDPRTIGGAPTTRMVIDAGGKVGIGTTTPAARLEVKAAAADAPTLLQVATTDTSLLAVRNDGKVGIGTKTPGGTLHIATGAADGQTNILVTTPGGTFPYGAEKADLVLTRRHTSDKTLLNGYPGSLIDFRVTNQHNSQWSVAQILGMADLNIPGGNAGGLAFLTSEGGTENPSTTNASDGRNVGRAPAPRMVIDAKGKVGIGTTAPAARFEVKAAAADSVLFNVTNTASASVFAVRSDGKVGIGTAPTARLDIKATTDSATDRLLNVANAAGSSLLHVQNNGRVGINMGPTAAPGASLDVRATESDSGTNPLFLVTTTTGNRLFNVQSDGKIAINGHVTDARLEVRAGVTDPTTGALFNATAASGSSLFAVRNDGKVGIGTTTPAARLEVKAAAADAPTLLQVATTDTSLLAVRNDGKVGIGTTTPGGTLHIATGAADTAANTQATTAGGTFIYGAEKADLVLTRRHHPDKAPLNGYPGSLIDFRTTNTVHEWSVAQILGMVDLNIPDRHAGGIAFLTSGGGTADASKTNPSDPRTIGGAPTTRMVIDAGGKVGIGTTTPGAMLDVRGDIHLGADGALRVPGMTESTRIIRGTVNADGTIRDGQGFTVAYNASIASGVYTIQFSTAFKSRATVVATLENTHQYASTLDNAIITSVDSSNCKIKCGDNTGKGVSQAFSFIAIGPR